MPGKKLHEKATSSRGPKQRLVVANAENGSVWGQSDLGGVEEQDEVELPCMFFPAQEMLLPGCSQVLHLYEARFLALLDEAVQRTGGMFAHVTYLPTGGDDEDDEGMTVNVVATLVRIESIDKEEVGALVHIVGESRMILSNISQSEAAYLNGMFTAVPVMGAPGTIVPSEEDEAAVEELAAFIDAAVKDICLLTDKLLDEDDEEEEEDDDEEELSGLEWGHAEVVNLRAAMAWVEGPSITLDQLEPGTAMTEAPWMVALLDEAEHTKMQHAERVSFACLQVAPASTEADLQNLVNCRAKAMSPSCGLVERLEAGKEILNEQRQALRAKVALKSLGISSA